MAYCRGILPICIFLGIVLTGPPLPQALAASGSGNSSRVENSKDLSNLKNLEKLLMQKDLSETARTGAAKLLVNKGVEAWPVLAEGLESSDPIAKKAVDAAIVEQAKIAPWSMTQLTKEEAPESVAASAARALGQRELLKQGQRAIPVLEKILATSKSEKVRGEATRSLALAHLLQGPEGQDALIDMLSQKDKPLRWIVAETIYAEGDVGAQTLLTEPLNMSDLDLFNFMKKVKAGTELPKADFDRILQSAKSADERKMVAESMLNIAKTQQERMGSGQNCSRIFKAISAVNGG